MGFRGGFWRFEVIQNAPGFSARCVGLELNKCIINYKLYFYRTVSGSKKGRPGKAVEGSKSSDFNVVILISLSFFNRY